MKKIIKSPEEMIELGTSLAENGHTHILLYGELGAGKTHFAKWFAIGLDIDSKTVTSPTYTYSNIYESRLLHCDFYRLNEAQELYAKWLIDTIEEHEQVLIEWPKREDEYADEERLQVEISKIDETTREVTIYPFGE